MIDNGQFEVRTPVLWFKAIGTTAPDGLDDLGQRTTTVYESALARAGDRFYLVDGALVHEGRDGQLSAGALTLRGSSADNTREAFVLTRANDLVLKSILNTPARVPAVPADRFNGSHPGIVRQALSPAFVEMMDATEDFRHNCDEDGGWAVTCSDYGFERKVVFSVVDIESQVPLLTINRTGSETTVYVADSDLAPSASEALRNAGVVESGKGGNAVSWQAVQDALSGLFFPKAATPAMAMALAV
ncbi:hypothetical protein [Rhizobium sp. BK176]|uniref:hypothetical protein n=1 Tax=Rhizobium sp. BK176 TaxID=2587071 RepID=UPI00216A527D|nr:hypothetical protein [Rhizobium sp. BK176]MCS4090041.1 hypothetical protein [Rhizobium sp. BK176]